MRETPFIPSEQPSVEGPLVTPIDPPARRMFFRVAMVLLALEPPIIAAILLTIGVPWWVIAGVFILGGAITACALWIIHVALWRPWQRRYPAQPVLSSAVSQSWQSIVLGQFGRLNSCTTIIADTRHLHVVPFAPLRLVGSRTISLPLDRMRNPRPAMASGLIHVDVDGRMISGPQWALNLVHDPA